NNKFLFNVCVNYGGRQEIVKVAKELALKSSSGEIKASEINEEVLMEDVASAIEELQAIREYGVKVSIDDFGTGRTALRWLHDLPVDIMKIVPQTFDPRKSKFAKSSETRFPKVSCQSELSSGGKRPFKVWEFWCVTAIAAGPWTPGAVDMF
ncbi:MAG: EAL domain-containing protein, partial [Pseudomonadota bacterium]|nr:EAL domain-containing protein [Pseudomonadota bacterium]